MNKELLSERTFKKTAIWKSNKQNKKCPGRTDYAVRKPPHSEALLFNFQKSLLYLKGKMQWSDYKYKLTF